ncbi:MAG: rRNA pseudouridine synthase [Actinomycetota bacterium]|nr:rRNA pseudouridine synthase [Actinomycetota bacterium]
MRLAKYLAHGGVASRRAAERMIRAGRVSVAGETVTDPARDVGEDSGVEVDGRPVVSEPREVWALNKPEGVVSTAREPGSRRAITELVDSERRLYPVGRLDADSSGLILLTNDGELANRLTHPRYGVPKTYVVSLARAPREDEIERLRRGVRLEDGPAAPARVESLGGRELEVTIREGRKRQVRRMAEAVGNEVESLRRVGFGPLELGELAPGEARRLGEAEVRVLWEDARLK